ncbi:MAG: hypothetical protein ACFE8O_07675 [Candidatus Hermodarchaeota archaeon]
MPATPLLAAALTIVVRNKKMLVKENKDGELELPYLVIAPEDVAVQSIQNLIEKIGLSEFPQQTLYLTNIPISGSHPKKIPAIIRVVPVNKTLSLDFPEAFYEPLSKIECDDQATALTRAVAQWLIL